MFKSMLGLLVLAAQGRVSGEEHPKNVRNRVDHNQKRSTRTLTKNIEHKCTLTIRTNLPKHKASKELIDFAVTLAQHAREILSSFKVKDYSYGIHEA
jgi:hypothetical protein